MDSNSNENADTNDAVHDELQRIPDTHEEDGVETSGRAVVDEHSDVAGSVEVRDRQQHRGCSPLEPVARAKSGDRNVGGYEAPHEAVNVDADEPD